MTPLTVRDEPFDQASGEWQGLIDQATMPVPFVTPAWQRVWLDHFLNGRDLRILTARDGERLIGVAPMLVDGDKAELVGHYSICDYMDVVVTPGFEGQFFGPVVERLASDGIHSIELRGLHEASPALEGFAAAGGARGYAVERTEEAKAPRVELPETWEDFLGLLSKKDRHELRRKLRRLDTAGGNVELKVMMEPAEACAQLDVLFRLMRISSHHKEEFLERRGIEAFFRDMTAKMASEKLVRFYLLTFDELPVAAVLNFDLGGQLYMYNSGYDPQYSHYAVGLMSKALLMRDAIEAGRTCVDFLRGDESYKYDLGGKDQQIYRLALSR